MTTQIQLPQQAEKEKDALGAMYPKQIAYQYIILSVVKSIYALNVAILFVMTYKHFAKPTIEESD